MTPHSKVFYLERFTPYFDTGDMFLPPSTKWGSSKHRPIHCFLYSNALVVIAPEKKTKYQSQVCIYTYKANDMCIYTHLSMHIITIVCTLH